MKEKTTENKKKGFLPNWLSKTLMLFLAVGIFKLATGDATDRTNVALLVLILMLVTTGDEIVSYFENKK